MDILAAWMNGQEHDNFGALPKWQVLQQAVQDPVFPGSYLDALSKTDPDDDKLEFINSTVNKSVKYKPEQPGFDVWQTPMQTMTGAFGDCEDFAFSKYWTLRSLGIPEDRLRVTIMHDARGGPMHAVTTLRHRGETRILDNQEDRVLSPQDVPHYSPIMEFNRNKWYFYGGGNEQTKHHSETDGAATGR